LTLPKVTALFEGNEGCGDKAGSGLFTRTQLRGFWMIQQVLMLETETAQQVLYQYTGAPRGILLFIQAHAISEMICEPSGDASKQLRQKRTSTLAFGIRICLARKRGYVLESL
jgi:hypothetical protein